MSKFNQIKQEIEKILPNSPLDFEFKHAQLVLKWVLKLKPDADEALKIAALAHDIDRAITKITEKDLKEYAKIDQFKKKHAERSARFITNILIKHHYTLKTIKKVKHLVANHEFGGDVESNILMDADSLAYFEYNIPSYLKRNGEERAKKKIQFMYKRLSATAKEFLSQIKYHDKKIETLVKESLYEIK